MAQHTFQEQLVSIMEILAKAAVAEINRRVDDSCAVIRLELSQSQRDIDTLKRKCQVMENELRKPRVRGRRKVLFSRTSEKLLSPFPSIWVRDTGSDICSAEQTDSPQEADSGPSTQHPHELAIQVLEDTPKVAVIKEEGSECETWNTEEAVGQFSYDDQKSLPHSLVQETSEGHNQLHEGKGRPSTHFTCMLSSEEMVKDNEEGQRKLSLPIKEEREQLEDKEGQDIVVEVSEQRMRETGDHLEFGQRDPQLWLTNHKQERNSEAEWTDKSFTSAQLSRELGTFCQDKDKEHCGDKTQMELFNTGQVNAQKQLQASWCRERQSSPAVKGLNTQLSSQQQHGSPSRTGDGVLGAGMAAQTESNMAAQALLGYNRSGLGSIRRFRTHWRTNVTGERRFSCSFCERCFVRFGQLKEHLRSHTGERPYTCAQCGRSFTKQGNLIRHAVVHSGEKPYQCSLCGKCFTQRSSLKSHQKTHMPERQDTLQALPMSGNGLAITQSRSFV